MTARCIDGDGHKPPDEMDQVADVMHAILAKTCPASAAVEEESDENIASTISPIISGEIKKIIHC